MIDNKTWKICMVGLGHISDIHFQAWQAADNAEIVAVCDLDRKKLQEKSEKYGIPPKDSSALME